MAAEAARVAAEAATAAAVAVGSAPYGSAPMAAGRDVVGSQQGGATTVPSAPAAPAAPADLAAPTRRERRKTRLLELLGRMPAASGRGAMANPAKPGKPVSPGLRARRGLTLGLVMPMFMLLVTPLVMTAMFSGSSDPRHMEVAVIGASSHVKDLRSDIEKNSLDKFDVSRVATVAQAKKQIRQRDIRAAYDPDSATMYYAGANGPRVERAVTEFFTQVAKDDHKTLKTDSLINLADHDKMGSASLFLALGALLGGFMTGVMLSIIPASTKVRAILGVVVPVVFATIEVIIGWTTFAVYSDNAVSAWAMLFLLSISSLAVTMGGMLTSGILWMPVSMLLATFLGMSASGVTAPLDMMTSSFYQGVHPWLFSAQGFDAVRNAVYIPDSGFVQPVLVMLAWLLGGIVLMAVGTFRQKKNHLDAHVNKIEEAETAMAAAAAI